MPHEERPRERLTNHGPGVLSDAELLALVLGCGRRGQSAGSLAATILERFGGLQALSAAHTAELLREQGIGLARAAQIQAALELGRRLAGGRISRGRPLRSSADAHAWLRMQLLGLCHEVFLAIALDTRHRVLGSHRIAEGTLSGVDVHPREVFRPLVREAAAAAIFAHNHPSGDPAPSPSDVDLTRRLCQAGELVGIRVLDHVIVAANGYVSLSERGLLVSWVRDSP